jgi:hypothetical protein
MTAFLTKITTHSSQNFNDEITLIYCTHCSLTSGHHIFVSVVKMQNNLTKPYLWH